jgi:N-acetylmuramoyl-L-alanine amidase
MAHINNIKRHLLREAVQENTRARQESVPSPIRGGRRGLRTWLLRVLLVGVFGILPTLTYVISTTRADFPGLTFLVAFVSKSMHLRGLFSIAQQDPHLDAIFPAPVPIDLRVFPLGIQKIAIDPGHGGADSGAVTSLDVVEKEVTLDIGHRLRRLLEEASFEVLMTRKGDDMVSLAQRSTLANTRGADLFVSIHVNSFKTSEPRGAETYYLGPTDDPHALQLAALENRASGYSLGEYRKLLDIIYLDVKRTESRQLAIAIQHELAGSLRKINPALVNRGVKMAPFLVLVGTKMPAVLAEVSYLSNQEEARLLATSEYRQRIAQALFQGIRVYTNTFIRSAKKGS